MVRIRFSFESAVEYSALFWIGINVLHEEYQMKTL